ncbi:unnamed protein product [Aphanomyces euteiches]|uniref:Uncharacterized protein n=1 Tax=Aphanomyces euteiches TaxID=100861 RepID=A0A6G0WAM6_9STRA|nr:hypothetical protein Ae201684_017758 [Aphanomyces euteiches]KAH9064659.1 hypothetical protein Ae201684P_003447 [Aphanomyces euteiches]KAH9145084.1 hypothetical protein AeRB84_011005 [Aphanomyces euteiches]
MTGILASFLRQRGLPLAGAAIAAMIYFEKTTMFLLLMQDYGWFVVLGSIVVLYLDQQLALVLARWDHERSLASANAPERVQILEIEARKARERQQQLMEEKIKASQATKAGKKKT